ncbi:hypothetical protein ACG7TL_008866 [Trametes sanguinea]
MHALSSPKSTCLLRLPASDVDERSSIMDDSVIAARVDDTFYVVTGTQGSSHIEESEVDTVDGSTHARDWKL